MSLVLLGADYILGSPWRIICPCLLGADVDLGSPRRRCRAEIHPVTEYSRIVDELNRVILLYYEISPDSEVKKKC